MGRIYKFGDFSGLGTTPQISFEQLMYNNVASCLLQDIISIVTNNININYKNINEKYFVNDNGYFGEEGSSYKNRVIYCSEPISSAREFFEGISKNGIIKTKTDNMIITKLADGSVMTFRINAKTGKKGESPAVDINIKNNVFEIEREELNILKKCIGSKLESVDYPYPMFEAMKFNFNDFSVVIENSLHEVYFRNCKDDVSYFTLKSVDKHLDYDFGFRPVDNRKISINEKILDIKVVNDKVHYNSEYDISFDVAVIFEAKFHKYLLYRDWYYMESIYFYIDKDIEDIASIEESIYDYKEEFQDDIKVIVDRTIASIKETIAK